MLAGRCCCIDLYVFSSISPVFDFEIQNCTRRCAETDRELKPGDVYYSVLIADGASIVRRDYAEDAWNRTLEFLGAHLAAGPT